VKVLLEGEAEILLDLQRYNTKKVFAQVLNVRPAEVGAFLRGQLPTQRTQKLNQLLIAGVPV
jgi:hypothetical protein